jgi:hypothetical protein
MSRLRNAFLAASTLAAGAGCASAPTVYQALDRATARVVAQSEDERRQCYLTSDTARAGKPSRTDVTWQLSMLGNPVHVEAESSPRDERLEACYTELVEKMQFPGGFPHSVVSMSIVERPESDLLEDQRPLELIPPPLAHGSAERSE